MAWWDHEELKSPQARSARYKLAFPEEYSTMELRQARITRAAELQEGSEAMERTRRRPVTRPVEQSTEEGTIIVKRALYGVEDETREVVRVPDFKTPVARIRVAGSATRNLGDYNSARVEVLVELPCYPEASELARAYELCSATVDEYIRRELEAALPPGAQMAGVQ